MVLATPRAALDLLERLDLPVAYPWTEDGSWVQRMSLALWDAGYTPHPDDDWNPRWYWLEGGTDLYKHVVNPGEVPQSINITLRERATSPHG